MSVQTEINRINTAKSDIATAIANKGVEVPSGTTLDGMAALIDGIESGGSVETCTVSIVRAGDGGVMAYLSYTTVENGVTACGYLMMYGMQPSAQLSCVKGSGLAFYGLGGTVYNSVSVAGDATLKYSNTSSNVYYYDVLGDATITVDCTIPL